MSLPFQLISRWFYHLRGLAVLRFDNSDFKQLAKLIRHVIYKIEYGVAPKKSTLKFWADFLSQGVFDYADYESDG